MKDLPDGIRVVRMSYDWMRDQLQIAISRPSFDFVPLGEMPPPFYPLFVHEEE